MSKQFDPKWKVPNRFQEVKWTPEADISFIGGISVSGGPLLEALLISSNQELYICTVEQRDEFSEIFRQNSILNTDNDTVNQILTQLTGLEGKIGSDETSDTLVMFQLSENKEMLTIQHGDFKLTFPMVIVDQIESQILIMKQLLKRFINFSYLQSAILSKDDAEIRNKNRIIIRLLVNHIQNTSLTSGLGSNTENLTDQQIYNHEAVQSLFLSGSSLRSSLESTPGSLRSEAKKEYRNIQPSVKLSSLFIPKFNEQWNTIAPQMSRRTGKSKHDQSTKFNRHQEETELKRRGDDSIINPAKYKRFRYLLGRKKRNES